MTAPTPEELAAFADGELSGEREAQIAAMVAADPELARQVERHRALRAKLSAHFAPILEQPVPERLRETVRPKVADFAEAQARRQARKGPPRWAYFAGPALAASLILALFMGVGQGGPDRYADRQLAATLDNQLTAEQADAPTRILLSFRDKGGQFCRVFSGTEGAGIACRDDTGWMLRETGTGATGQETEYRQVASDEAALMAAAQDMADGGALDAQQEEAARASHWQ